ncbi:MAG: AzlD domain-containing protein, partial [Polaromonas sp.]|nr:AzlD domain-containing protein [Polaromonas sp.]
MAAESTFLLALLGMALASFACRISGFLLMGYVRITPRVEAALKAIPLSVMVGIVTPAATSGKLPELLAL